MWSITPRSGWHKGAYIMPDGSIIGEPEQPILFNGGTAAAEAYSVEGTAESWRENVARLAGGCKIICVNGIFSKTFKGLQNAYQQRSY
ncbi:hypothetical protein SODG_004751 [Sodalis praecaptivus]